MKRIKEVRVTYEDGGREVFQCMGTLQRSTTYVGETMPTPGDKSRDIPVLQVYAVIQGRDDDHEHRALGQFVAFISENFTANEGRYSHDPQSRSHPLMPALAREVGKNHGPWRV